MDTVSYEHAASAVTLNLSVTTTQSTGGAGSDTLSGFENVVGSAFDDVLTGSSGVNTIIGSAGNYTIAGGGGADILTGGSGADKFVFAAVADSTPSARDFITDFVSGTDTINLSAIDANTSVSGDQAFLFGGQNANVVAHTVTWVENVANGNTIVSADVNGNTTADVQIVLHGINLNLHATDFLL